LGQNRGKKRKTLGREDVLLVHPQNGFNGLILNWCIGGYWFTLALSLERLHMKSWAEGPHGGAF